MRKANAAVALEMKPIAGQEVPHPVAGQRLQALYRDHWQELCRYIARNFGQGPPEPEDVVQVVFARYAALDQPEQVLNPRAFLYAAARNVVLDHRRSQNRIAGYVQDVLARAGEEILDEISPERLLMEQQRFALLQAAIKRLPDKQKRVLAMNRLHGMTYEQIAARTGWSLADISRQLNRALAALEQELEERAK